MKIHNTIALVTGANPGISAALVQALLAERVAKMYAAARREADLATLRARENIRSYIADDLIAASSKES